ncbi:ATP-grasp domain-containing protein [Verminephrobacter aporrectodeae subsp. tuberculatae]|uniref:ATP-grasp domain-containing protein n=1 Tax=Verminephrobacter aporrectodeae TaxID=1110389 RepID=UPI0022385614|nr:ATP-grasp domain-containing protein [Verminephrobacter aporrectodeae]MCW5220207.1 ATP-grasp domain-containing protein [Verminephrobacter aporrectodeae subsp. tuberculatae]MCW5289495.1 ATP-grasp domain-containing protein [Verminephrobacter aporrectodeae subsp. tuberculatae]
MKLIMVKTLVFITQAYVNFASDAALEKVRSKVRTVLVLYRDEVVNARIARHMDDIVRVGGALTDNVRPVLSVEEMLVLVEHEIGQAGNADAVRVFCQEECNVLGAATIRVTLDIPGDSPDMVQRFRDKLEMKEAVAKHGVRVPAYEKLDRNRLSAEPQAYYDALVEKLGKRLVVKPTRAAGSFNVTVVESYEDFFVARKVVEDEIFRFEYEVDEFISGTMYQCDSFVRNGIVVFSGILELGCSNFDFVQGKPLSVYPAIPEALRQRLFQFNQDVVTALGFENGSTHHELFFNEADGSIVFLEIAARVPGGIGVPFHEKNSHVNLIDANLYYTVDPAWLSDIQPIVSNNVVSALLPVGHGTVVQLNEPEIESRYEIVWNIQPGAVVNSRSLVDNAGILTLYNDDRIVLRRDFERLQHYVPVTCK